MTDFDIDNLMNDDLMNNESENNNLENNDLNAYKLIFFTDGSCLANGKETSRSGFGIYIICNDINSIYYNHNDTKIIKAIKKDLIMYNKNTYDMIYYNLTYDNENDSLCNNKNCTYYAIYNKLSSPKDGYCKSHKKEFMELNNQYFQYFATNIRAEAYGILYSLVYLKFMFVDGINNKNEIYKRFKLDKIDNIKNVLKPINFNIKSNNKFLIVTDSKFWIELITKWCNTWIRKGLVFDKKNIDLIIMINYYMNILYDNNIEIVFKHIHGHADKKKDIELNFYQKGNVMADKLANIANNKKDLSLHII